MPFSVLRRVSRPLSILSLFAASALAASVQSLHQRSDQTQAQCSPQFDWAQNSQKLTPCLLTAYVSGSCSTGNWDVPALTAAGLGYTSPNSTTANPCTCSWAAYNLISACTACQGFDAAVENWAAYNQNCNGNMTDTWFPSDIPLPTGTAIPFWAGVDPTTWNDGHFDKVKAQSLAEQNKPEYVQGENTTKKSKPVGAIAGGVVGGVAVLAVGGLLFRFMRKRDPKNSVASQSGIMPYMTRRPPHGRSVSDFSGKSILDPRTTMSMANSHRPGTIYTTAGTLHTHNASVHSLSYNSGYTSPVHPMSPPLPAQSGNPEDHIEPFTLRPTSPPVSLGIPHKTSRTTLRSTGNNTSEATPAVVVQERYETGQRAPMNPPPYSLSPTISPASSPEPTDPTPQPSIFQPGHRTGRGGNTSVDTQTSYDSDSTHGRNESASAIDEVIGRMGLMMPSSPVSPGSTMAYTVATGQSGNIPPRHKPSVSNPDNDPHN